MPAGWRQSSVGSSTPAAELPAVVATKVAEQEIRRVLTSLIFFVKWSFMKFYSMSSLKEVKWSFRQVYDLIIIFVKWSFMKF